MPYRTAVPEDIEALHELGFGHVEEEGPSGDVWIVPKRRIPVPASIKVGHFVEPDGEGGFHLVAPKKLQPAAGDGRKRRRGNADRERDDLRFRLFVLTYGLVPHEFYQVKSACENRNCVSPDHAVVVKKARKSSNADLTDEQVVEIRGSTETVRSLAKRFGVNPGVISAARNGRTYRHVRKTAVLGKARKEPFEKWGQKARRLKKEEWARKET